MADFFEHLPIDRVVGLRPDVWICVGQGFAREEVKAHLLKSGGLVSQAVTNLPEIARMIVARETPEATSDKVLSPLARQEILRVLLTIPQISRQLVEIKRLKRQSGFLRRLDSAIQAGRMAFAHDEERSVYEERLLLKHAEARAVRAEVAMLGQVYEAWLEGRGYWDAPLLLKKATEILDRGWPDGLSQPQAIYYFSAQLPESLERSMTEALARELEWVRVFTPEEGERCSGTIDYQRWHTIDDAVESLADALAAETDLSEHVVLIPETPAIRRSLNRALAERKIPQADPRDPTRIRWDEGIKKAMLPLELIASDFERTQTIGWMRAYFFEDPKFAEWVAEIHSRGVRRGARQYRGGKLIELSDRIEKLVSLFDGRRTAQQVSEAHLGILTSSGSELLSFFEKIWRDFITDLGMIGEGEKRAPFRYWFERFRQRVSETPSPVEPLKPESGLAVYRFQQIALTQFKKIWGLGISADWLRGDVGDAWWSTREREVLSSEFAVRGPAQVKRERVAALKQWISNSDVTFIDAEYDFEGREKESLEPLLREIFAEVPEPREMGSHPRWIRSYSALRPVPPQTVELTMPGAVGKPVLTATALDRLSRCSFQGLAFHRWKLKDLREPEAELWPDVRGNILHEAVHHLLESRDAEGNFAVTPAEALDRAWTSKPPYGLLKSPRIESYARSRMLDVLLVFCSKERDYFARAGAKPVSLENLKLKLEFPEFTVIGTPDRIDEGVDGLFVIDYKTSSVNPNGTEMLERGYRLQLPFYALAAQAELRKPVVGVQFVELNRTGSRSSGMFFKEFNGKDPGKFTNARSNSKSLLSVGPEEAWSQMEGAVRAQAAEWLAGRFAALPKIEPRAKECDMCMLSDLCGYKRLGAMDEALAESARTDGSAHSNGSGPFK